MTQMFEKLLAERRTAPSGLDTWFTDHPLEEDRIQATRDQVAKVNPIIIRTLTSNTPGFEDFKAHVHALPYPAPVRTRH